MIDCERERLSLELSEWLRTILAGAPGSAARFVPDATCLPQALAAEAILRRRGHPADLRLGVSRGDDGVEAHAWVESYGRVIVGDGDLDRLEPLEASDPARPG